jgi:hypothetical protein
MIVIKQVLFLWLLERPKIPRESNKLVLPPESEKENDKDRVDFEATCHHQERKNPFHDRPEVLVVIDRPHRAQSRCNVS